MNDTAAISLLESRIGDARAGLPEDIFLFATRITPMVNVDLLLRDTSGRTLLTWRDDRLHGPGWHVPGGIVRFKETFAARLHAVARLELGARIEFDPQPLALNEVIHPSRADRGHFISLLFACRLLDPPQGDRAFQPASPRAGDWSWHASCPPDLIRVHHMYRPFLDHVHP